MTFNKIKSILKWNFVLQKKDWRKISLLNCKYVSEKTGKSQKRQDDKRKVSDNYDRKRRAVFV